MSNLEGLVDIIIPVYRPKENGFEECLKSIADNYNPVYVHTPEDDPDNPIGFTANVNRGLTAALDNRADTHLVPKYFMVLNQDTIITPGAIDLMVKRFEISPKAGIVSAQIRSLENKDRITFGGALQCFPVGMHKAGFGDMLNVATRERWLTFVAVMIKREALRDVGLLDPNLRNLGSDADYCLRMRQFGYECWYEPEAKIYHRGGVSQAPNPLHKFDMIYFMEKWMNGGQYQELMREVL